MRDRLIELIANADTYDSYACKLCSDDGSCELCNAEKLADHLLENGVTVQEWISVKDRLPNCKKVIDGETYFNNVAVRVKGCGFEKIAYYDDEEKYWFDTNFFPAVGEVTHWCELPNGICPNRRKEIRN